MVSVSKWAHIKLAPKQNRFFLNYYTTSGKRAEQILEAKLQKLWRAFCMCWSDVYCEPPDAVVDNRRKDFQRIVFQKIVLCFIFIAVRFYWTDNINKMSANKLMSNLPVLGVLPQTFFPIEHFLALHLRISGLCYKKPWQPFSSTLHVATFDVWQLTETVLVTRKAAVIQLVP